MTDFVRTIFLGLAALLAVLASVWLIFSILSSFAYIDLLRGALLLTGVLSLVVGVVLGSQIRLSWGLLLVTFGALTLAGAYLSAPDSASVTIDALGLPEDVQKRVMERSPFLNAPMVLTALLFAAVLASLAFKRGVDPGKVVVGVVAMLATAILVFFMFTGQN